MSMDPTTKELMVIELSIWFRECNTKVMFAASKKKKDGAWKPKKYHVINMFVPNNEHEEIILLLLIR
jgi:hypothetical protein